MRKVSLFTSLTEFLNKVGVHQAPINRTVGAQHQPRGALFSGYLRHMENRENGQKKSLSGKTRRILKFCQNRGKTQGILSKHRENTSCKCSYFKSKGYCDSCRKKIHFFPEAG